MGYYTKFDINRNQEDIVLAIEDKSGYNFHYGEIEGKWYSWQSDIKEVSLLFPDTEIHVEGEGEESLDIWKAFAKNGELFISEIQTTFGPYVKQ